MNSSLYSLSSTLSWSFIPMSKAERILFILTVGGHVIFLAEILVQNLTRIR